METPKYLYMKKFNNSGKTYCILHTLGAYHVIQLFSGKSEDKCLGFNFSKRRFKTVSGASRFLNTLNGDEGDTSAEEFYETKSFIDKGSYIGG